MTAQLKFNFSHAPDHFDRLHADPHGVVLHWEQRKSENAWTKLRPCDPTIPAFLAAQQGQPDRFVTVNEFRDWRLVRLLRSLRACYVDVDNHADLERALEQLRDARMPPPSLGVFSGRGLHLYWLLEPVGARALPVWQRIQDALVAAIDADPRAKDCTRVLRLVGTVNSKTGTEVRGLVLTGARWTLHELADEVLGRRPEHPIAQVRDRGAARVRKGRQTTLAASIYARWHLVYQDLLTIARWYDIGGVPHGHRNMWLFIYSVALSWFASPVALAEEVAEAARIWTPGLGIHEAAKAVKPVIERATKAAAGETVIWQGEIVDPRYRFRRATLFERFSPIIPTDLLPQLRAIIPDALKGEREAARLKARDRVIEGRHESHKKGRKGLGAPWVDLGVSRRTYFRLKSEGKL